MQASTIVLAGNGSYSNRGCEAIVRGTTKLLQDQVGSCRFLSNYFPSIGAQDSLYESDASIQHAPFPVLQRYSLPWVQDQVMRKLFHWPPNSLGVRQVLARSFKQAEAVLMLGGDNFSLDYSGTETHFRICEMARQQKLPVVIWGASVGPFMKNPEFEKWAAEQLRQVSLICARETATMEYLDSIGLRQNVLLSADPSYFLHSAPCELPEPVEKALVEGCIGVNLSPLLERFIPAPTIAERLEAWTQKAVEILQHLRSQVHQPILLIPHVISEAQDPLRDDYLFLKGVSQRIGDLEQVLTLGPQYNAAQTKWIISRLRAFAGARTHSTLAGITTGVPTLCIGYSMKARGIAQDVYGHLNWLLAGSDLIQNPTLLTERFLTLLEQECEIRAQLDQGKALFVQRAVYAADQVGELVHNCHNQRN